MLFYLLNLRVRQIPHPAFRGSVVVSYFVVIFELDDQIEQPWVYDT